MFELGGGLSRDPNPDGQFVVKSRGRFVIALDMDNDQEESACFHLSIIATPSFEQLRARQFEVVEVVGMMNHSHRIGLAVADTQWQFKHIVGLISHSRILVRPTGDLRVGGGGDRKN